MKVKPTGEAFEIKKFAKLANLDLSKDEEVKYSIQFAQILSYMEKIRGLKIEKNVETTSQVTGLENVTREDETAPSLTQEEALSNTKNKHNGLFKVKAILEA